MKYYSKILPYMPRFYREFYEKNMHLFIIRMEKLES